MSLHEPRKVRVHHRMHMRGLHIVGDVTTNCRGFGTEEMLLIILFLLVLVKRLHPANLV